MKYIFDECVSDRIASALKELGEDVEPYHEHWKRGADDLTWIPQVAALGHCVVSSDDFGEHERAAIRQHGARFIVVATAHLPFWEQVRLIVNRWEVIKKTVRKHKAPFIFKFTNRRRKGQSLL